MNDFTKEELQIILRDMNAYINRAPMLYESTSHKALQNAINEMIKRLEELKIQ